MSRLRHLLFGGSLRVRLVKLVIASALAAIGAFFALSWAAHVVSRDTGAMSSYINRRYDESARSLGDFMVANDVTEASSGRLGTCVHEHRDVEIEVFSDEGFVYASDFMLDGSQLPSLDSEELPAYDGMRVFGLELADGTPVTVYLFGSFSFAFLVGLRAVCAMAATLLFFVLFLWGVTRRVAYVRRLESAVVAMGAGDLETPVEVRGDDELASLASQMDQMRVSFSEQIESEKSAKQANRDLVTTMSHDLRTPLTSLLLYVQILKDGKYADEAQLGEYLDKIYGRSMQIKTLSDSLFHHFLVEDEAPGEKDARGPLGLVMGDLLAEFSSSLEAAGFDVVLEGSLEDVERPVDESALARVLDNLLSNIYKYAARHSEVTILAYRDARRCEDGRAAALAPADVCGLRITNEVEPAPEARESTRIGLENVRALMSQMGGSYRVERGDARDGAPGTYTSVLEFSLRAPDGRTSSTEGRN